MTRTTPSFATCRNVQLAILQAYNDINAADMMVFQFRANQQPISRKLDLEFLPLLHSDDGSTECDPTKTFLFRYHPSLLSNIKVLACCCVVPSQKGRQK